MTTSTRSAPVQPAAPPAPPATSSFVAEVRARVDARLDAHLREATSRASSAGAEPRAVATALGELVRRGGKRLRPALVAASARACGRSMDDAVIDAGCAWELLQAYFLVHDDWMDGDPTRRGGPSVHVALSSRHGNAHLGASLAVLAGDLGCALAHRVLIAIDAPAPIAREAMSAFARVHEEVILGQVLDLTLGARDATAVERMHALKTGSYTARGPIELGAILAGTDADTRAALDRFAAPLGVAFQLRDDLLGAFGAEAETGKPVGSDLRARKRTALVVEAIARLPERDRARLERLLEGGGPSESEVAWAVEALDACGARGAIEARTASLLAQGRAALDSAQRLDPEGKALLESLAVALAERRS
jgi:geranylgeranyl diphosphate synthase type I